MSDAAAVRVTLDDRAPLPSVGLICTCGRPVASIEHVAVRCDCGRVWIIHALLVARWP